MLKALTRVDQTRFSKRLLYNLNLSNLKSKYSMRSKRISYTCLKSRVLEYSSSAGLACLIVKFLFLLENNFSYFGIGLHTVAKLKNILRNFRGMFLFFS